MTASLAQAIAIPSIPAEISPPTLMKNVIAIINIRVYQPSDHQTVLDLFQAGMTPFTEDADVRIRSIWEKYISDSLRSDLADIPRTYFGSKGHFWVATVEENGQEVVIGCVGVEGKGEGQVELRRMSVASEYRRFGVGRLLIKELEEWCRRQALQRIFLSTGGVMMSAHRFYAALGYDHYKTDTYPGVGLMVLHFEKILDASASQEFRSV